MIAHFVNENKKHNFKFFLNNNEKINPLITLFLVHVLFVGNIFSQAKKNTSTKLKNDLESYFTNPPESANQEFYECGWVQIQCRLVKENHSRL